jgi:hypothetical protein
VSQCVASARARGARDRRRQTFLELIVARPRDEDAADGRAIAARVVDERERERVDFEALDDRRERVRRAALELDGLRRAARRRRRARVSARAATRRARGRGVGGGCARARACSRVAMLAGSTRATMMFRFKCLSHDAGTAAADGPASSPRASGPSPLESTSAQRTSYHSAESRTMP